MKGWKRAAVPAIIALGAATAFATTENKPHAPVGVDKATIESYLRERLVKVKDDHKARTEFMAKQAAAWNEFWTHVRDERTLFETRLARQRLDLFESLSSLNPRDRAAAIGDFERLQSNVVKAFETELRQKMDKFFREREAIVRGYAANQEKSRQEFAAAGDGSWQAQKASALKVVEAAKK